MFSLDEGAEVGRKEGTPLTADFNSPFAFTSKLDKVTIALSDKAEDERSKAEPASEENRKKRSLAD
jgi:arylsulfatase